MEARGGITWASIDIDHLSLLNTAIKSSLLESTSQFVSDYAGIEIYIPSVFNYQNSEFYLSTPDQFAVYINEGCIEFVLTINHYKHIDIAAVIIKHYYF